MDRRNIVLLGFLVIMLVSPVSMCHGCEFPDILSRFSVHSRELADFFSESHRTPLPSQARRFFEAAIIGDELGVRVRFESLLSSKDLVGTSAAILKLQNELWYPIWELYGAHMVWEDWGKDSELICFFATLVLESIPERSVFFGGTDQGRFIIAAVAAYSNYPIYLVAQNALSDSAYSDALRTLYGERMWLPSSEDISNAFAEYSRRVEKGDYPSGSEIVVHSGVSSVRGTMGVMMLNGIIARMIFEQNKAEYDLFVEESYAIEWMYPYLKPHGAVMKLNPEPMEFISSSLVEKDREYWNRVESRLQELSGFDANNIAREAFAKLRSGIGGIYKYREMHDEAEAVFLQALRICPAFTEAAMRLARVYQSAGRKADAVRVLENLLLNEPRYGADEAAALLEQLKRETQGQVRGQSVHMNEAE